MKCDVPEKSGRGGVFQTAVVFSGRQMDINIIPFFI